MRERINFSEQNSWIIDNLTYVAVERIEENGLKNYSICLESFGKRIELLNQFIDIKNINHYPQSEKMLLTLFKSFHAYQEMPIYIADEEPLKSFSALLFRKFKTLYLERYS